MDAQRLQRVQELYHLARERDAGDRVRFLAEVCDGDDKLRREVESLLAQDSSPGPMERPPMEIAADLLADSTVAQLTAGTKLGPYTIESSLGAGGMGQVYKARDTRLGRSVAIKIANHRFGERSEREARAISALNHPHICTLYDVGPNYLVMEVVEGETLVAVLRRGPLPVDLALRYGTQIAEALSEAHSKGIVHRDLKPGNIMVTTSGSIKIIDFGLAKRDQNIASDATKTGGPQTAAGAVMGTALYMSPEQAEGKAVDARSDVFSTGAVLYEMFTGTRAFASDSTAGVLSKVLHDSPQRIRELRMEVPQSLERIVTRCLEKNAALRYPSGRELANDLVECSSPARAVTFTPRVRVLAAIVLIAVIALAGWLYMRERRVRWARDEAIPKIRELLVRSDYPAAFDLAREALRYLPKDPQLKQYWSEIAAPTSVKTTPPGAKISYRPYGDANLPWRLMGQTPFENFDLPTVDVRFRIEKEGWQTEEFNTGGARLNDQNIPLVRAGLAPAGMVPVRAQTAWSDNSNKVMPLPDYFLDRFEVTNHEFQQFIDAGGYRDPKYWLDPFEKDGREIPFGQAVSSFHDATGRTGPAGWELGGFPKDKADYPAGGVSWYEAAAYCNYAGKSLPTVHHWRKAAGFGIFSDILLFSNFDSAGPSRVGALAGISAYGAYDMAGNVKEWCRNSVGGLRAILGGGWKDPSYKFTDPDAQDPFARDVTYGFRCATYPSGLPPAALDPIGAPGRDYSKEKPVADATFEVFRRMYAYDKTPLDAKTESVDDSNTNWRKEKVSYSAAYGAERIRADLYLPKNAKPPYQTVLWVPGGWAWGLRNSDNGIGTEYFNFLMSTGRAVLYPVYKGTYERHVEATGPNARRDLEVQLVKDAFRSVDFLESRPDIQSARLAFYGMSSGAYYGVLILALEPRLKTGILLAGGFVPDSRPSEVDPFNFAPHIRVPVIMLNGRYDFVNPPVTSQQPLFRWLGTPEGDKRLVQSETGHMPRMQELMREVLNWLDQRLGPVETKN